MVDWISRITRAKLGEQDDGIEPPKYDDHRRETENPLRIVRRLNLKF